MSLAIVYTRAQVGIDAPLVSVEVHLSGGLPGLSIVGLPEAAVKESKDRVRGAILNSQFEFPIRRITISTCRLRWVFWRRPGKSTAPGWSSTNFSASWPSVVNYAGCVGYCQRRWPAAMPGVPC